MEELDASSTKVFSHLREDVADDLACVLSPPVPSPPRRPLALFRLARGARLARRPCLATPCDARALARFRRAFLP